METIMIYQSFQDVSELEPISPGHRINSCSITSGTTVSWEDDGNYSFQQYCYSIFYRNSEVYKYFWFSQTKKISGMLAFFAF